MFGLLDIVKMGGTAIIVGGLAFGLGYWRGDDNGYGRAQAENRQADFDQAKERMETDEEIEHMSDSELCGLLGGEWVHAEGACK